jgi:fatty-acid peroxygenase
LHRVAFPTDPDGSPLDDRTAAVELLNLLRPTVAVAWFVALAAATIAEHPETRHGLCPGEPVTTDILTRVCRQLADRPYEMSAAERAYRMEDVPTRPRARLIVSP